MLGDNYKSGPNVSAKPLKGWNFWWDLGTKNTCSELKYPFWSPQTQLKTPRLLRWNICFVLLPQTLRSCSCCANTNYPVVSHVPANKAATGPTAVRVIRLDIFNDTCRHFQLFLRQKKKTSCFLKETWRGVPAIFNSDKTRCLIGKPADVSRCRKPSSICTHDRDDQNTYFKRNHDFFLTLCVFLCLTIYFQVQDWLLFHVDL